MVSDFCYAGHIDDPYDFEGNYHITTLKAHQEILEYTGALGKMVWFDVHIWNDNPRDPDRLDKGVPGMKTFVDALEEIGGGVAEH